LLIKARGNRGIFTVSLKEGVYINLWGERGRGGGVCVPTGCGDKIRTYLSGLFSSRGRKEVEER